MRESLQGCRPSVFWKARRVHSINLGGTVASSQISRESRSLVLVRPGSPIFAPFRFPQIRHS